MSDTPPPSSPGGITEADAEVARLEGILGVRGSAQACVSTPAQASVPPPVGVYSSTLAQAPSSAPVQASNSAPAQPSLLALAQVPNHRSSSTWVPPSMIPIYPSFAGFRRHGLDVIENPSDDDMCSICLDSFRTGISVAGTTTSVAHRTSTNTNTAPHFDTIGTHVNGPSTPTANQSTIRQSHINQCGQSGTDEGLNVVRIRRCPLSEYDHLLHRDCITAAFRSSVSQGRKMVQICPCCRTVIFHAFPPLRIPAPPTYVNDIPHPNVEQQDHFGSLPPPSLELPVARVAPPSYKASQRAWERIHSARSRPVHSHWAQGRRAHMNGHDLQDGRDQHGRGHGQPRELGVASRMITPPSNYLATPSGIRTARPSDAIIEELRREGRDVREVEDSRRRLLELRPVEQSHRTALGLSTSRYYVPRPNHRSDSYTPPEPSLRDDRRPMSLGSEESRQARERLEHRVAMIEEEIRNVRHMQRYAQPHQYDEIVAELDQRQRQWQEIERVTEDIQGTQEAYSRATTRPIDRAFQTESSRLTTGSRRDDDLIDMREIESSLPAVPAAPAASVNNRNQLSDDNSGGILREDVDDEEVDLYGVS